MSKNIKNPLLSGAGSTFPFENFSGSALLMPVSQNELAVTSDDFGEADNFLGQDSCTNLPASFATNLNSASTGAAANFVTSQASVLHDKPPYWSNTGRHSSQIPSNVSTSQPLHADDAPRTYDVVHPYGNYQQFQNFSPRPSPSLSPASRPAVSSSPLVGVPLVSSPLPGQPFTVSVTSTPPLVGTQPPLPGQSGTSPLFTNLPVQPPSKAQYSTLNNQSDLFSGQPQLRNQSDTPPLFISGQNLSLSNTRSSPLFLSNQPLHKAESSTPPPAAQDKQHWQSPQAVYPQQPQATVRHTGQSLLPQEEVLVSQSFPSWNPSTFTENLHVQQGVSVQSAPQPRHVDQPSASLQLQASDFHGSALVKQSAVAPSLSPNTLQTGPGLPPSAPPAIPIGSATNSYRLGSQKKLHYAQPPGISRFTIPSSSQVPLAPTSIPPPISVPPTLPVAPTTSSFSAPAFSPSQPPGGSAIMADSPSPVPLVDSHQSSAHSENGATPSVLPPSFTNLSQGLTGVMYRQVYHHWFLKTEVEGRVVWNPFSMKDSLALEDAFTSTDISPDTVVATNGGRYDVNVLRRQRLAVYWDEPPHEVRRCSWFSKSMLESRYIPYEENISTRLEEEFKIAVTTNTWGKRVELPNAEEIVLRGFNDIVHYPNSLLPDAWGGPQPPQRPRTVKRGVDEFHIEEGEPDRVDHLLFVVHGIGSVCDLKFRKVEEVVDDFRSLSHQLVQSHFSSSFEQGKASRIEVLPVSWHATLHGEATGIDQKLQNITLRSIPKLRHFTNDTLLDILFYTSPVYCQTIMDTVGNELNRIYQKFLCRNPSYQGGVSLVGHSLGSVILFDLLCHQKVRSEEQSSESSAEKENESTTSNGVLEASGDVEAVKKVPPEERKLCQRMSYVMGNAGTGQPYITYPQIKFQPSAFFALGSPIAMFVTVRGNEMLGEDFCLPTCPAFFNIFHPFDPVAYRMETLMNPDLTSLRPLLIPHHKGRKRMHLELKETMSRLGSDLKQRVVDSVRNTWNAVYQLAMFHRSDDAMLEEEVNKVLEQQITEQQEVETSSSTNGDLESDIVMGQLNKGRRIDHVLQEAPLESFNEYVFAMTSHVCYWDSEDTMLVILKELYGLLGISSDAISSHVYNEKPQDVSLNPQFGTFLSSNSASFTNTLPTTSGPSILEETYPSPLPSEMSFGTVGRQQVFGMDPTAPPSDNQNIGPPPMAGFVRKT